MTDQRGKPGRKPTGRQRESNIQVRVSDSELAAIKKAAHDADINISTLLRNYALASTNLQEDPSSLSLVLRGSILRVTRDEAKDLLKQLTEKLIL